MTNAVSDWVLAATVALCGILCVAFYLVTFSLSRRLLEQALRPTIGLGDLVKPLACGMLLGLVILAWHGGEVPAAAGNLEQMPSNLSAGLAALVSVGLAGLCAGGWSARPQAGGIPVAQSDLVRRLCLAGNTHEDATARVAVRLALAAGYDRARASDLLAAASLHDIGKSGIPASILNKTTPLSAQERELLRSHTRIGHRMLARSHEPMLDLAASIALHHHERWDGGGYPGALAGEGIPLTSRAVTLAEAFDELLGAVKVQSGAVPSGATQEALALSLQEAAGLRFDPHLVALLLADLPGMIAARNGEGASAARTPEPAPTAAWLSPGRFRGMQPERALV